jgi:hypothetical protein
VDACRDPPLLGFTVSLGGAVLRETEIGGEAMSWRFFLRTVGRTYSRGR